MRLAPAVAIAASLAASSVGSLAGCSFAMTGPPAHPSPVEFPKCDEEATRPTLDLAWAVLFAATGALLVTDVSSDELFAALGATGASAALFGGAAVYGFRTAAACRRVRDDYRARYEQAITASRSPAAAPPPHAAPSWP